MSKEAALNFSKLQNTPVVDPPKQPGTTPETDSVEAVDSRRLAVFAKREAQMQKEREAFKLEQEKLKKEREEVNAVQKRAKEFDELKEKDPVAALKLLGFSEEQIFNYLANAEKKEPTAEETARKVAQEESQKIRDDLAKEKKENEERRNKELIDGLKKEIGETLKLKPDAFKYCSFRGAEAELDVFNYINQNLKENNELLTPEEALKDIEELYQAEAKALLELTTPKTETQNGEGSTENKKVVAAHPSAPKTLTNKITSTASAVANAVPKHESRQEKRARLEEALRRGHL